MKTDKRTQLLKILSDASQSISSAALANMLGTSERTVRNYIKTINEEGKAVVTSSRTISLFRRPLWMHCPRCFFACNMVLVAGILLLS